MRDHPGIYDKYYVDDLTQLKETTTEDIQNQDFNCVAVASATGWGNHIPVEGLENAFNLLPSNGWFVYHIKRDKKDPECVNLCQWIDEKIDLQQLEVVEEDTCFHRYSINNKPIYYDVIIGTKS
ncbi:MAG: hypothetical protein HC880_04170 [Bacteroidia bacterium]|nr:hypothetical protein [Bacteroidia bacterium]